MIYEKEIFIKFFDSQLAHLPVVGSLGCVRRDRAHGWGLRRQWQSETLAKSAG